MLIFETGFFNSDSPTVTSCFKFSSVAKSTEAKFPVNVSSYKIEYKNSFHL